MRGRRLIHLWGSLTHCCEKKRKASINSRKSENYALKVRSLKFSIIAEVPTITAFVAAFDATALNCTELLESYLAGGNRIINCHRQTNRNRHNLNIWHNTWSTLFKRITPVFYLYCKKNKHTAPIQYAWQHKDFKSTTWRPRCNSLTTAVNIWHTRAKHLT